jgi:para-aminobenzoate synthetase/4-amino-4-deoxychorismate lyase
MVVDMIRSDLGRVARTGGISVPSLYDVERHPTLWQMTSTVEAELAEGVGLLELVKATFPSGSVTGAPKPSTMGIIAVEESAARGVYCGAIGFIAPGGHQAQFSVAIRTGIIRGGGLTYHVGGGVTHDSDAATEYAECLVKALVVTEPTTTPDLLESMRVEPGAGIALLDRHLARLAASAAYWDVPLDPASVGEALSAVATDHAGKVRLILRPDGGVEVEVERLESTDSPVTLHLSEPSVDPIEPIWYHKTLDRRRYPDSDDGSEIVLVNVDGYVTETNRSNLFARVDGAWVTPRLDSGCLPGVYRQIVLDRGEAIERFLTVDDLRNAGELAVSNAVRGWRKAVLFG